MTDHDHPQQPEPPDLPAEQLDALLKVYCSAWVSGFVSAGISAAATVGMPEEPRRHLAHRLSHQAAHTIREAINDPITRHVIVDGLQRLLAGMEPPEAMELPIPCADPSHRHDEDGR